MDMHDKLSSWGATYAAAREAERNALGKSGPTAENLRKQAHALRERANRLHNEILGQPAAREGANHAR